MENDVQGCHRSKPWRW